MAIVKLRKVTLLGQSKQYDSVLVGLQQLGCVHLVDLIGRRGKEIFNDPTGGQVREALRYLESCRDQRPSATHVSGYDAGEVSRAAISNREQHRELAEEREDLVRSIAKLEPWGNFTIPSAEQLGGNRLWFYKLRHRMADSVRSMPLIWSLVASENEFEYIVVVSPEEPTEIPVAPIELGDRSLADLRQRLEQIDHRIEQLDLERISLTRWVSQLKADLAKADDETARMIAAEKTVRDGEVFALQGWVPENRLTNVEQFASQHALAIAVERPNDSDQPPTLLTNPDAVAGAEGAVTFYMTPSYRSWDPTWIMYFSFSLFFAMIMADAGYGLILAVLLAIFYGRMGTSRELRLLRSLAMFMIAVTVGYGVLIGSYFGYAPPQNSLMDRLVWKSGGSSIMNDREAMMLFSAAIGVFHLTLANLVVARQRMGSFRALAHVGWALALVSGLVMAIARLPDPALVPWIAAQLDAQPESVGAGLWTVGSTGLVVGLAFVFLFTSERPLFSSKPSDWLWRPLEGLIGLTNISKAFGDALSYLRLFALGLASAQLAITFNDLSAQVSDIKGVGLLLGLLIFIAGHSLNLLLGIVGGVVHGLRLNCIEFFGWSLTDEGYPFQAFRKKADC